MNETAAGTGTRACTGLYTGGPPPATARTAMPRAAPGWMALRRKGRKTGGVAARFIVVDATLPPSTARINGRPGRLWRKGRRRAREMADGDERPGPRRHTPRA